MPKKGDNFLSNFIIMTTQRTKGINTLNVKICKEKATIRMSVQL